MATAALTVTENTRLSDLEETIEQHVAAFYEVGNALAEIRDGRLYRTTHGTFEDYCQERWQFTKSRANQLIESAKITAAIDAKNDNHGCQINERQTRELAKSSDPPKAWKAAVESAPNGKVTAKHVARVVEQTEVIGFEKFDADNYEEPEEEQPEKKKRKRNEKPLSELGSVANSIEAQIGFLIRDIEQSQPEPHQRLAYTDGVKKLQFAKRLVAETKELI